VRAFREEHYSREISLEQLAQIAELSSFHLNRSFRQTVGMPPHAYQIQVRIIIAKRLLRQELSITSGRLRQRESSHCHWICESKPLWNALQAARLRYSETIHPRQQEHDKFQCLDLLEYRDVTNSCPHHPLVEQCQRLRQRTTG
jgi:AraC-like DNA-binding protein